MAVAQLQLAAALELAVELDPEPAAALELLEELELLQPAASKIDPTAATVAAIAFDARN